MKTDKINGHTIVQIGRTINLGDEYASGFVLFPESEEGHPAVCRYFTCSPGELRRTVLRAQSIWDIGAVPHVDVELSSSLGEIFWGFLFLGGPEWIAYDAAGKYLGTSCGAPQPSIIS